MSKIFERSAALAELLERLGTGSVSVSGLCRPLWAALADVIARQTQKPAVVVVPQGEFVAARADAQTASGKRAAPFPEWDILPYEHKYPAAELVAERIFALWKLLVAPAPVIITTPAALMWKTIPPSALREQAFRVGKGMEIPMDELATRLVRAGYRREQLVEFLQTFARRGEIIDFFSPAHPDPVRVEFFGDVVDQIRLFSTHNRRWIGRVGEALFVPAVEGPVIGEATPEGVARRLRSDARNKLPQSAVEELLARTAFDSRFPGEIWFSSFFEPQPVPPAEVFEKAGAIFISVEPEDLAREVDAFAAKARELRERVAWEELQPPPPEEIFQNAQELKRRLLGAHVLVREVPTTPTTIDFGAREIVAKEDPIELLDQLASLAAEGEVFVFTASDAQRKRIERRLGGRLPVPVRKGTISQSFALKDARVAALSGDQILGFSRAMFQPPSYHQGRAMLAHYGIEPGDLVVHSEYGIARFLGIKTLDAGNGKTEFLQLEFADGEKLYVPIEDFYLVNPYIGPSSARLSKLGGKRWAASKARARRRAFELAGELVRIYALRQIKEREPFPPAPEWEEELAKTFPYEETPDQRKAIEEVLSDLAKPKPMDRLLCGDVGFGKTEVALRAAVRVVASGKQVAVLVPTTILAAQHFDTFRKRLANLPVRVEMLCRFTPPKLASRIIEDLAEGKVDIVVGTHMLLTERVRFRELGLLIVDEEQWFGVRHKERLKALRAEVDVLTMTATPIPRTLYFSISGLRDISLIETAPRLRKAVFTQIVPWNLELFAKAVYNELERGGQVFFVHNRVETIGGIEALLKRAMPDVRIAVAHGKMPKRMLEKTVLDFREGKYDLLLSTAIIESGTDMPRVNTIIINRADQFGLAQLYQLRGRVGRSDVQAYAYLVIPPYRSLSPDARKRLKALLEHTQLGSGYHLALKDLEIRGAGNLLGKEQSGFVEEVGLDLYSKMLAEAVAELKGQPPPVFEPVPFSIDFDALLPPEYIPSFEERLGYYQRLFTAERVEKVRVIEEELSDRFGKLPPEAQNLVSFVKARILATKAGFSSVSFRGRWVVLSFSPERLPLAKLDERLRGFQPPPELIPPRETGAAIRLPKACDVQTTLRILTSLLTRLVES